MEVKDYCGDMDKGGNSQYNGVPSAFGKRVDNQNKMQPKYSEPGDAGEGMRGEKSNAQKGP